MFSFPPLPPWDGLHPLVIHFPIALIFVSPLVVLLALVWKKQTGALLVAGSLIMALAAAGAWVATSTGSAAAEFARNVPGAETVLEAHEELGDASRNFATALAAALVIGTVAFWKWREKISRRVVLGVGLVFLIANGAGALVVANTAHQGGRLVHEIGVRARLGASAAAPSVNPTGAASLSSSHHGSSGSLN